MKRKKPGNIVYSTNPDFFLGNEQDEEEITLSPNQQQLRIRVETKGRKGKIVTIVEGFAGKNEDLEILTKELKVRCGTGGSAKHEQIILQGDNREKALSLLVGKGYMVKKTGG